MEYTNAQARYREHCSHTENLLEEEVFALRRKRVDVLSIGAEVLQLAAEQWYPSPERRVQWDWASEIIRPLRTFGPRALALGFRADGILCGMMAARLSPHRQWLSLTHVEGAPFDHPLKGGVVPLSIRALFIYRGLISVGGQAESIGVRILRPLEEAIPCYEAHGYTSYTASKRLPRIVIAEPIGAQS